MFEVHTGALGFNSFQCALGWFYTAALKKNVLKTLMRIWCISGTISGWLTPSKHGHVIQKNATMVHFLCDFWCILGAFAIHFNGEWYCWCGFERLQHAKLFKKHSTCSAGVWRVPKDLKGNIFLVFFMCFFKGKNATKRLQCESSFRLNKSDLSSLVFS